jgi:hypothetical protein
MADTPAEPVSADIFDDALVVLLTVVDAERRLDDAAMAEIEEFRQGGDPVDRLLPTSAIDAPVPRNVVLAGISLFSARWFEGGAEQIYRLPERPRFADGADPEPDLAVTVCLHALADLWFSTDDERADSGRSAAGAFLELEAALEDRKRWLDAAKVASVARNLAGNAALRIEAGRRGVRTAAQAGILHLAAYHLVGLAAALTEESLARPGDPAARAAAFTALEAAARHLRDTGPYREQAEPQLVSIAQGLDSPLARALVWLAGDAPDEDDSDAADQRRALSLYTRPIWELDDRELAAALPLVMSLVPDVEQLTSQPLDDGALQLETSWTTGTFDHPRYRQAIPHGRALFREGRLESILFEITHEVTHVVSMLGGLGAAAMALRAAALELEATLWAHVPGAGDDSDDGSEDDHHEDDLTLLTSVVAPLTDHTPLALGQAEQALEPVRCMRILQRVWTPWLEGVAVFLELGSDPSEGEVSSLIGDVLANLVDAYPFGAGREALDVDEIDALLAAARAETERLYTDLLATSARPRLRHYLGSRWSKYGPGYLAVRAVVATWRVSLGREIRATEAARVLLHLTRYGTHDPVPDLGLGSSRFLPAAEEAMVRWVRTVAGMSRDDLEYVLAPDGRWGWVEGHLLKEGDIPADEADDSHRRFRARARQAWDVHRGEHVDVDRVPDADATCRYLIGAVARALSKRRRERSIAESLGDALDVQSRLLPVGSLHAPFWLNVPTNTLVVGLRTTEEDKDHGGPGFDMEGLRLERAQAEALAEQIRRRPGERLHVTRLADLTPQVFGEDRLPGLNVIAYSLGTWLHVRAAGLAAGWGALPDAVVTDVRERLMPSRQRTVEAEVCEGITAAARTMDWIERAAVWRHGDQDLPVEAWARHVHELARLVRDRPDEAELEQRAASALLTGLWGAAAEPLASEGITVLTLGEAGRLGRLVEVLLASAVSAGPSAWLEGLAPDDPVRSLMVANDGWDVRPLKGDTP